MGRVTKTLILAHFFSSSLSSPILTTSIGYADTSTLSARAEWKAAELNNEFKGIWWNHLLEDKDDGCTPEQIDKIVYATRYALKLTELPRTDGQFEYSAAWDRYFKSYKSWITSGSDLRATSANIMFNIMQASRYPKDGHTRVASEGKRVHFTCNPREHGKAKFSCAEGKQTAAVTVSGRGSEWERWTLIFCPYFFSTDKLGYLEEKTNGKRERENGVAFLRTYEHVLAHEFMHVDMFGHKNRIKDIKAQLEDHGGMVDAYGDDHCHELSLRGENGAPDERTASNADSYAWFFTYYWFDKHWEWTKRRHNELKKGGPLAPLELEDSQFAKPEIDFPDPSFPVNGDEVEIDTSDNPACRTLPADAKSHGNPRVVCQYVDEEYSVWRDGLSKPFKSSGGCELS
ncbi:hypothetical protein DE146DRAFT_649141 [Phaeosphaeria sp. MPI-PUGE-AT-0046c]|nr:hypothetical protein DE146DRAFT_649141 [Phaeosphaeria sp. MPI-PUGE-AT-0046c]